MNKSEFISAVAKDCGTTKESVRKVVESFFSTITTSIAKGEKVDFIGFGSFSRKLQKGREGLVPGTKKKYKTNDKNVPSFKAGKKFKDSVEAGK